MSFNGKTVVITGAAGNLARAVAKRFAAEGATLVLIGQHMESLPIEYRSEGRHAIFELDLLKMDEVSVAIDEVISRFGRIDVLCNLAGGFRMGEAVHEISNVDWDFLLDVNVRSVLNMAKAVVSHMVAAGSGHVVNVGAAAAQKGAAQMGGYIAAKSVVMRLTETMSAELKDKGVHVNCVLPTIIDTPENRSAMPEADPSRWVKTEDMANVIFFLASDQARAIHGASLPVSGLV